MKQLIRLSLIIILTRFVLEGIVGCKKSSEKHYHSNRDGVQLDGGKKRKANAETTQGIEVSPKDVS